MVLALPARSSDPAYASVILDAVTNGNYEMPFSYVTSTYKNHTGKFLMSTDCLKIDGVRWGVGAYLMQQIADALGCLFPTPKLRDLLYLQRSVDLPPITMWAFHKPADWPVVAERGHGFGLNDMTLTSTMRFISSKIDAAIAKTGRSGIAQTVGKPWVLTNDLLKAPGHAANYGWYYHGVCPPGQPCSNSPATSGLWMIQGPGTDWLRHDLQQADYAQTITLVHRDCIVDDRPRDLADIYRDPELAGLVSHEGPLKILRQPGVPIFSCTPSSAGVCPTPALPSNIVASFPPGVAWEPEEIVRPSTGPVILATVGLILTIGGFFGGLALMGRAAPKHTSPRMPRIYENPAIHPEFRVLVDAAQAQGWTVGPTKSGHLKFQSPTGAVVFASSSPSDWRASRNLRTTLRRAGLSV